MTTPLMEIAVPLTGGELTVPEQRELQQCELIFNRHRKGFLAYARALHAVWEKKLWRATCSSFETYCKVKLGLGERQAYRYLEGYRIVEGTPNAQGLNGAAVRVLACAPPDKRQEIIDLARKRVATKQSPLFAGQIAAEAPDETITLTAEDIETVIGALRTLAPEQQMEIVAGAEQQLIEHTKKRLPGAESQKATAEEYRAKGLRRLEMVRKIAARFGWTEWEAAIQGALRAAPPLPGPEGTGP